MAIKTLLRQKYAISSTEQLQAEYDDSSVSEVSVDSLAVREVMPPVVISTTSRSYKV